MPGVSSSRNWNPASTITMSSPTSTIVMFFPISSTPPSGMMRMLPAASGGIGRSSPLSIGVCSGISRTGCAWCGRGPPWRRRPRPREPCLAPRFSWKCLIGFFCSGIFIIYKLFYCLRSAIFLFVFAGGKDRPYLIGLSVPLRQREEAVVGCLDEAKIYPCNIVRDTIHEIGRIEKYGRNVLVELRNKCREQLAPLLWVGGCAELL